MEEHPPTELSIFELNDEHRPEKHELILPSLKTVKKFDFTSLQKSLKRISKPRNKILANIEALAFKNKKLLDDRSLQSEKFKERRTLNKTYKHVQPKYLQKLAQNESKKVSLPILSTLTLFIENDLETAKVLEDYRIISHVGKGCFSVVSSAISKKDHHRYAIKTYTRIDQMDQLKIKNIQSQVKNLFKLKHENIISLVHAVKDGRKIQLIMENGGKQSLAGLLRKFKVFDEPTAKGYFKQIASAISHCHSQNVCHRDLKLENILVDDQGKVKIIDFGFSTVCQSNSKLNLFCGTPPYMSPEIASRSAYNGFSADIWALGISLYLMLYGKFPFRASDQKQLYRLIQQGKYKVNSELSSEVKTLFEKMLKVNESGRATANQILESEWLCS